jgi:hypothetical protein
LPERHTYTDSYADREPDSKSDSDAKGKANAEAASHGARLRRATRHSGQQYEHTSENRIDHLKFY